MKCPLSTVTLVIIGLVRLAFVDSICPKVCQCKWRNGKQWVICSDAKFIDIPRGVEPSTQVLNLERNNLKILFRDAFVDQGLVNLQKVFLTYCQLRKLEVGSFRRLANLIELDLSNNWLRVLPSDAFADISGLRELKISKNLLTRIPERAFEPIADLVHLDLSYNNISTIYTKSFWSLSRLEILKLSGNKLKSIWVSAMKPLVALHEFHLHYNMWHCDCTIRRLRHHMQEKSIAASVPPVCSTPLRLKDSKWKRLKDHDFVCRPSVKPVEPEVYVAMGNNVTLMCRVEVDTVVNSSWIFNGHVLNASQPNTAHKYSQYDHPIVSSSSYAKALYFTVRRTGTSDQGVYVCAVENKAGNARTAVSLHVIEMLPQKPFFSENQMFITGIVLGALLFVLSSTVIIAVTLFKRIRRSVVIKSDSRNGISLEISKPERITQEIHAKPYDYKSIPTVEPPDSIKRRGSSPSETWKCQDQPEKRNILNNLDKCDKEDSKCVSGDSLLTDSTNNISRVETPKANNLDQESPLLKLLAQQCRDEIVRRKNTRHPTTFSHASSPHNCLNTSFPDLLNLPHTMNVTSTLPRRRPDSFAAKSECLRSSSTNRKVSLPSTPVQSSPSIEPRSSSGYNGTIPRRSSLSIDPEVEPTIDYSLHASQLEQFLHEYKTLQCELQKMKEAEELMGVDVGDNSLERTLAYATRALEQSRFDYSNEVSNFYRLTTMKVRDMLSSPSEEENDHHETSPDNN